MLQSSFHLYTPEESVGQNICEMSDYFQFQISRLRRVLDISVRNRLDHISNPSPLRRRNSF